MSEDADGQPDLDAVCRRIRTERRILGDERTAFRAFLDRLGDHEPPIPPSSIRDHYRATVMSVPHYHQEYDDRFPTSVAAEFGAIVAEDLQGAAPLDTHDVAAVVGAGERAIAERDAVIDRVDAERYSVETAASDLATIRADLHSLAEPVGRPAVTGASGTGGGAVPSRLAALRERTAEVASERRRHLRGRATETSDDSRFRLQALLYRDCSVDRPVLAAVRDTHRAIEDRRQAMLDGASAGR